MSVEQEMMRLASERSRAMDLAAAAGRFLAALDEYPDLLIATHTADMLASRVDEREV